MKTYNIGGLAVQMTPGAAARWNAGETTRSDLARCRVIVDAGAPWAREVSLARATNRRLEPEVADMMDSMYATLPAEAGGIVAGSS